MNTHDLFSVILKTAYISGFALYDTQAADSGEWCLYVHTDAEVTPELLVKVAEIVNKIAGGLLQNSIIYLHPILSCAAYEIPLTLDRLRIRQDHHAGKVLYLQISATLITNFQILSK